MQPLGIIGLPETCFECAGLTNSDRDSIASTVEVSSFEFKLTWARKRSKSPPSRSRRPENSRPRANRAIEKPRGYPLPFTAKTKLRQSLLP